MNRKFCVRVSNTLFVCFFAAFLYIGIVDQSWVGHIFGGLGMFLSVFFRWFVWQVEKDMRKEN